MQEQALNRAEAPKTAPRSDILHLTAQALRQAIGSKAVSCAEVMAASLDHIEQVNPLVNAIVALRDRDRLMDEARQRDAAVAAGQPLGPLHGFPLAIKDLQAVEGLRTTSGSPIFATHVPPQDSLMVERLRRAGAIVIGKTNVPEFGLGSQTYNSVYGATGNAYDASRTAGGSSGGAAVAVALRMTTVADGSDFGGSLRNPTGWNNVFGLRPSFGRVPSAGRDVWGTTMTVDGPIARNIPDLALLLSVQAGYDPRAPLAMTQDPTALTQSLDRDFRGCRIAWLGDYGGALPFEPGVIALCETALKVFETLGCSVEPALPDYPFEQLMDVWRVLRAFHVGSGLIAHYRNPAERKLLKPEAIFEVESLLRLGAAEVAEALERRTIWYEAVRRFFASYDYFILPTAQVFPFPVDVTWPRSIAGQDMAAYYDWMRVVIPVTLSGCPVIAAPAGFGTQNLPMGIQIVAPIHGEFACLQLAHAYDRATRWPERRPPPQFNN